MNLGKPIREVTPEPEEWEHTPTSNSPHLWTNRKTGMMENRAPTPAPLYKSYPYIPPVYVDVAAKPELLDMDDDELAVYFDIENEHWGVGKRGW